MDTPLRAPICLVVGPLETSCYIFAAGESVFVVDPGGDAESLRGALRSMGDPAVAAILLTHGHYDHTAAAAELSAAVSAPVLAHAAAGPILAGEFSFFGTKPPAVEATLFDDEALPIAAEGLTVIHTPGHSPGSVVYVTASAAFVGDVIFRGSVGRVDLPGGDEATLLASLRRLLDRLPHDLPLYPGHGPDTTLADELLYNPWVQEAASL